jgi:1-acyl-sn-glycerol-3-phosphate acyltransferase
MNRGDSPKRLQCRSVSDWEKAQAVPRCSRLVQALGQLALWLLRFRLESPPIVHPKLACICAPHTSNWDLPIFLAAASGLGIRVSWLGKHSLFRFPLGGLFRALGGIPVDRTRHTNLVQHVAEIFRERDGLILGIAADGTRKRVEYWKSGFYQIAMQAGVPIGLAFLDFKTRSVGLKGFLVPTGDVRADMDLVRATYAEVRGKYPHQESVIRLMEEETR